MADELLHIVGCLSEVYPLFVSQFIAEQTAHAAAMVEAVTDPIGALLDKNVDALVADMTALSAGDPLANMAKAGIGLLWQEKGRDILKSSLDEVFASNQSSRKDLASAETSISKVLSLTHLFISVSAEAPYALAQLALRTVQPIIDQKQRNIGCLRKHLVLLNNALLTIGLDPIKVNTETAAAVQNFLVELQAAKLDLADVERSLSGVGGFLVARFASARNHLDKADAIISPQDPGSSIYDIIVALGKESAGPEFFTTASRRLAVMTAHALSDLVEVEFAAIKANTRAINFILAAVKTITEDLAKVHQSAKVRDLRIRLLRRFDTELNDLIQQVIKAQHPAVDEPGAHQIAAVVTSSNIGRLAIPWAAEVRSLRIQAQKIANADLTQAAATGTRIDDLKRSLLLVQAELAVDFPPDIVQGIENTDDLELQITVLHKMAAKMFAHVEAAQRPSRQDTEQANIEGMLVSLGPIMKGVQERLGESQVALDIIGSAVDQYVAVDIPISDDLLQIADIMGQLGMSRAACLLITGSVKDLMGITKAPLASYAGLVLECLLQSAHNAPDQETAQVLLRLADKVKLDYINKLVTASDYLSGAGIEFVNDIRARIEDVQRTTATVRDIIARLTALGVDVKKAAQQIQDNLGGLDSAQAVNTINADGPLNGIKRQISTAGFGPPPGCSPS